MTFWCLVRFFTRFVFVWSFWKDHRIKLFKRRHTVLILLIALTNRHVKNNWWGTFNFKLPPLKYLEQWNRRINRTRYLLKNISLFYHNVKCPLGLTYRYAKNQNYSFDSIQLRQRSILFSNFAHKKIQPYWPYHIIPFIMGWLYEG